MKRPNPYIDLAPTVMQVLVMLLSATVYVFQLFYGSVRGFVWFTLGKKTEAKRRKFHETMCRFFRFDIRWHPWLHVNISNPYGETFSRGSIVICNHQSLLDTLCLLILSPRILLVTHDKVWNNPLVAAVLRYADFFSVSDTEWEGRLEYFRSFVEKGYSIVVFPEGKRSADGNILRFHKGAFFLAEQIGSDILPMFIHGAAHVLPAGKAFANKGDFYIEIGKRICPDDRSFGENYAERCKQLNRYYREHFEEIRYRIETAGYYRYLVIRMFASIGLQKEAQAVLDGQTCDRWDVNNFMKSLVLPDQTVEVSSSSPLRKLYKKYTHLPKNILFV